MATQSTPEIKTHRYFGTSEQSLAESVNLVRNYLRTVGTHNNLCGGIYTRMFNYLTKGIFTKVEFVEKPRGGLNEVNYAKYQVCQALRHVRAKLKEQGQPAIMDISMIINHFEKY
jgi:hypothetical protein